jgi:hypothetical protein
LDENKIFEIKKLQKEWEAKYEAKKKDVQAMKEAMDEFANKIYEPVP